jgi:hypothetical protein
MNGGGVETVMIIVVKVSYTRAEMFVPEGVARKNGVGCSANHSTSITSVLGKNGIRFFFPSNFGAGDDQHVRKDWNGMSDEPVQNGGPPEEVETEEVPKPKSGDEAKAARSMDAMQANQPTTQADVDDAKLATVSSILLSLSDF